MNGTVQNKIIIGLIALVLMLLAVCYYIVCDNCFGDYHDIDGTVQRIEENNERARANVESAASDNQQAQQELRAGQRNLDDAQQSAKRLQDSADERAKLISDAEQQVKRSAELTQRQRDIYREIEEANQKP